MPALMEVWRSIQDVVTSVDVYALGAAVVIIIAAGFAIESPRSVVTATFVALILYVVVKIVLAITVHNQYDVDVLAAQEWKAFVQLPMLVFTAHALIFGATIALVSTIRNLVR